VRAIGIIAEDLESHANSTSARYLLGRLLFHEMRGVKRTTEIAVLHGNPHVVSMIAKTHVTR
jgi:hypothetical protein